MGTNNQILRIKKVSEIIRDDYQLKNAIGILEASKPVKIIRDFSHDLKRTHSKSNSEINADSLYKDAQNRSHTPQVSGHYKDVIGIHIRGKSIPHDYDLNLSKKIPKAEILINGQSRVNHLKDWTHSKYLFESPRSPDSFITQVRPMSAISWRLSESTDFKLKKQVKKNRRNSELNIVGVSLIKDNEKIAQTENPPKIKLRKSRHSVATDVPIHQKAETLGPNLNLVRGRIFKGLNSRRNSCKTHKQKSLLNYAIT